ncbi:hypothetical protein JTB14_008290 [Gonioctena quinquepunctata]|nr:hypothetical protein JTB14_008290 [Gonioctena quinquepunctata]
MEVMDFLDKTGEEEDSSEEDISEEDISEENNKAKNSKEESNLKNSADTNKGKDLKTAHTKSITRLKSNSKTGDGSIHK